jgi:hypothetical protein
VGDADVKRATIHAATLRDATYVMAWLRPADELEVMCQVPEGTRRDAIAYSFLMSGDTFSARLGDQPIAIFGTSMINAACLSVWALGTKRVWRAVPAINDFMTGVHLPERIRQGYHSMEARSHVDHEQAHSWLKAMGGTVHGLPFEYGRGREKFLLFRWSSDDLERIRNQRCGHEN